jgi:hypothetical protein
LAEVEVKGFDAACSGVSIGNRHRRLDMIIQSDQKDLKKSEYMGE